MIVFYVTARSAAQVALLAGPFTTAEAASRHEDAARRFLAARRWKDTLGAFIPVGVSRYRVKPGRRARRARFHDAIVGTLSEVA